MNLCIHAYAFIVARDSREHPFLFPPCHPQIIAVLSPTPRPSHKTIGLMT